MWGAVVYRCDDDRMFFFFFQAEDGIRDIGVTGVQTCAVPIADTQNVLSSAHAAIQRNGREVSLVDLGSLNGTHVAGPEATEWTQLEPGVAHPLSDGDRLLLGWTVITFEQQPE